MKSQITIDDLPFSKAKQLAGMIERNKTQTRFKLPPAKTKIEYDAGPAEKKNSPHDTEKSWLVIGGKRIYVRSKWERNVTKYLQWLKESKNIKDWHYEPERFMFDAIKRGNNSYLPDFKVIENDGSHKWWEVKGRLTAGGKTKIIRFMKYYPKEKLVIIDEEAYRRLARDCRKFDWWE